MGTNRESAAKENWYSRPSDSAFSQTRISSGKSGVVC